MIKKGIGETGFVISEARIVIRKMKMGLVNFFAKDSVGKQMVRSADSIAANVMEGQGRYFYKDRRVYCYYSRGSAQETLAWLEKCKNRNLVTEEQFGQITSLIDPFNAKLNRYISTLNTQIKNPSSRFTTPIDHLPHIPPIIPWAYARNQPKLLIEMR